MSVNDLLLKIKDAWRDVEFLRVEDPRASKSMARLVEALRETAEYIEARRWKGDE